MGCVWIIDFTLNGARSIKFEKHTGGDYSKPSDELVKQWIAEYLAGSISDIKVKGRE